MFFLPIFSSKIPQGGDQRKQPTSVNLKSKKWSLREDQSDLSLAYQVWILSIYVGREHSVGAQEKDID